MPTDTIIKSDAAKALLDNAKQPLAEPTQLQGRILFKIITLGCRVNRYESDAISQQLQAYAWEDVELTGELDADCQVFIINTCGVTGEAARKSKQMVRKFQKLNAAAYVVAVGCQVDLAKDTLGANLGIGNNEKNDAGNLIYQAYKKFLEAQGTTYPQLLAPRSQSTCTFSEYGIVKQQNETRAFIKIQDGCELNCSYCAIPLARGPVRSRQLAQILQEAEALLANGFKEIVLTGIHISSYGMDLGRDMRKEGANYSLLDVCKAIDSLPGLARLRLGSLEPRLITAAFVKEIAELRNLTPHFHLSLQSGSDTVLRRMRRRYTTGEYSKAIALLQEAYPNLNITTDIIAGFPGETYREHQESMAYVKAKGFTHLHVFPFSPRAGTVAAEMPNQLDNSLKRQRSKEFIQLNNSLWLARAKQEVGAVHEVLLEQIVRAEDSLSAKQRAYYQLDSALVEMTGYSFNYLPLKVFLNPTEAVRNKLLKVKVFAYTGDYLLAKSV